MTTQHSATGKKGLLSGDHRPIDIGLAVVTFPIAAPGTHFSANLSLVLKSLVTELYLITGETGYRYMKNVPGICVLRVVHAESRKAFMRPFRFAVTQFRITLKLLELGGRANLWVFHTGGNSMILPVLVARLVAKPSIVVVSGVPAEILEVSRDRLSRVMRALSIATYSAARRIVVYSKSFMTVQPLSRFAFKTSMAHEHHANDSRFANLTPYSRRKRIIGFLGRLSGEKGVLELLSAFDLLRHEYPDMQLWIAGDGPLRERVQDYVGRTDLAGSVRLLGFVQHEDVPALLNQFKLLVLPSRTEGLPTAVVEAMACGTPVVATSVGSLRDIVQDGITGYVIKDTSPGSIVAGIERALSDTESHNVLNRAQALVESEFTFAACAESYRRVLDQALRGHSPSGEARS